MSWLRIAPVPIMPARPFTIRRRPDLPVGAGPYTERHDGPAQERMEPDGWRRIYDDYEDGSEKSGYPYVDLLNATLRKANATCPYCTHEMVILENPDRIMCPFCRRQLAVSDPKEQRAIQAQPNPERESVSRPNLPMDQPGSSSGYDWRDYPTATGPLYGA